MTKPLSGIRVVDSTHHWAGSYCGMLLADAGADVVKIEEPGVGDSLRKIGTLFVGGEGALHTVANRGKKSLTADLRKPEGQAIVRRLVERADVFVQNFKPGTIQRYGLAYEQLSELNPRLVYCSISAFGQNGPYSARPGLDPVMQAMSGLMSITGEPEGAPVTSGAPYGDTVGAMTAFQGILLALVARQSTGRGQHVSVSLLDALFATLAPREQILFLEGKSPPRLGSAHPTFVPYQAIKCKDGYMVVAAVSQKFFLRFMEVLGLQHLAEDPRFETNPQRVQHRKEMIDAIEQVTMQMSRDQLHKGLTAVEIPHGPVNELAEAMSDPQILHNEMVVTLQHAKAGAVRGLGYPIKLSDTPGGPERSSSLLGEHTEELMKELGYSQAEIDRLRQEGVI